MNRNRLLLCLIVTSLLLPSVGAGTQEDPEVVDPAGDHQITSRGTCQPGNVADPACETAMGANNGAKGDQADILAVWVSEPDDENYTIHVQTAAATDSNTRLTISYTITPTEVSLYTGSEDPIDVSFTVQGTTAPTQPANTTVVLNGTVLEVTLTRRDTGSVGGDSIQDLVVASSNTQTRTASTAPVSRSITTTDRAPNANADPSRPFNLSRPPIVPDIGLAFLGGSYVEEDGNATPFTRNLVQLTGPNATVTFDLELSNVGTDPDNVTFTLLGGVLTATNVTVTIEPEQTRHLLPGETEQVTVTATLQDAAPGDHAILVQANSARGAIAATAMQVSVPQPPAPQPPPDDDDDDDGGGGDQDPAGREPVPAGLSFLTPMAEGLGLDGPFGKYAELVLLALILLLVILIVFLIVFLATRGEVAIEVEPRVVNARPGETAEFTVRVRNKRGRPLDALTHFEGDPSWATGLAFGESQLTQPDRDAQLGLGPKDRDSGTRVGTLRVTVPSEAHDKETDHVTVAVAPLDGERQGRVRRATVKVRAAGGAAAAAAPRSSGDLPMRLVSVTHEPEEPVAGQTVETTARLENDSDTDTLELRVVLNLDGEDVQERDLLLPPHSARAVVFAWEAPQGSSKVRVRVYPKD